MAKSNARKKREHLIRNGKLDPASQRGLRPDFSTHTRRTPSKVERLRKTERKYKPYI